MTDSSAILMDKGTLWTEFLSGRDCRNNTLTDVQRLTIFTQLITQGTPLFNLTPLCPLLLNLEGEPYSLRDHFPFEILFNMCMPRKIVMKTGRQCFTENNLINAANGELIKFKNLKIGDEVLSLDKSYQPVAGKVTDIFDNGEQECYRVRTRLGSEFEVTDKHKFLTISGYTELKDLTVGSKLVHLREGGSFKNIVADKDRIILTGYILGDGGCSGSSYSFTSMDKVNLDDFKEIAQKYQDLEIKIFPKKDNKASFITLSTKSLVREWIKADNLEGLYSYNKFIPPWVFDLSVDDTCLFLARLWSTDGHVGYKQNRTNSPSIEYYSTCKLLAKQVQALLMKLGIASHIHYKKPKYRRKTLCRPMYEVAVETKKGWTLFLNLIKVLNKPAVTINASSKPDGFSLYDNIPKEIHAKLQQIQTGIINDSLSRSVHKPTIDLLRLKKAENNITRHNLKLCIDYFDSVNLTSTAKIVLEEIRPLLKEEIIWDNIISIEKIGLQKTYNMEVEGEHNYFLDGCCSKNSGKSMSVAAHTVLMSSMRRFHTLCITPLYEQIRRFSNNYLKPFVNESPVKDILVGPNTENSVLQRSFKNGSIIHCSYASLTPDRARGIKADKINYDELQDIDPDHINIINESLSHSKYGIVQMTGTPKDKANTMEAMWRQSSQAEWIIQCSHCNFENIPTMDYHLEKMIGPWHQGISEERPGIICYKCGRPTSPRHGRWMHKFPDRRQTFLGAHVPQILLPLHYANPEKWSVLLHKQKTMPIATFLNETMGESSDIDTKLISETELQKAACLHQNIEEVAIQNIGKYTHRVLAIDWGGGGVAGVSYTKIAVLGFTPQGTIDVIYGKHSLTPHNHVAEALLCKQLFQKFHCHMLVHDYTGAGNLRETVLVQTGLTTNRLMPIELVRTAAHALFQYIPASDQHPRSRWRLDKARSLQLTCYAIKFGLVKFFKYDYESPENPGLLHDFLALIENKVPTSHGSDIYTIQRNPLLSDDFAQAVNLGCAALWHIHQAWPDFSRQTTKQASALSEADTRAIGPIDSDPWGDDY